MLRLVDERPHLGVGIERIADADRLGALGQAIEKAVVQAILDEDARAVRADLAGRVEIGEHGAANGILDIGVVENDERRLAAELHRGVLHQRPGEAEHLRPVGTEPVSETLATTGWLASAPPTSP